MKIDDLTVGEARELVRRFSAETERKVADGGVRIVVLQRGWVVVGRFSQIGPECRLTDANVIRVWGTTKGLGEIALGGPIAEKTILDPCPDVIFHELTAIFQMQASEEKWAGKLR